MNIITFNGFRSKRHNELRWLNNQWSYIFFPGEITVTTLEELLGRPWTEHSLSCIPGSWPQH